MYGHIDVPMICIAFLKIIGCLFDTSTVLAEDELEPEGIPWAAVGKMDRYIYATISTVLRDNGRILYTFQVNVSVHEVVSVLRKWKPWIYI